MKPIPLTETQMAELFRLREENAEQQKRIDELRSENRIERNLRIGVEAGFDCANEEIGRLKAEVDYWKTIRTENAVYFEKREAELIAERDEWKQTADLCYQIFYMKFV